VNGDVWGHPWTARKVRRVLARLHMVRRWKPAESPPVPPVEDVRLRAPTIDDVHQVAEVFRSGFGAEGEDGYPSIGAAYQEVHATLTGRWGPFDANTSVVAIAKDRVIAASLVVADDGYDLRPLLGVPGD
jgi:hypothetical protein